jgi:hypothetical protein
LQQAALYTYYLLEFWKLLVDERLAPTKNADGKYFSMEQFKHFFNTSRKPGILKDDIISYFEAGMLNGVSIICNTILIYSHYHTF